MGTGFTSSVIDSINKCIFIDHIAILTCFVSIFNVSTGIVHNGFGIYATWTTIATLLNLAIFLTYNEGVDQHIASTISLSVLALEIVAFAFIDNIYLEK